MDGDIAALEFIANRLEGKAGMAPEDRESVEKLSDDEVAKRVQALLGRIKTA
jgi:hypothetical protein